jgi:hypothetical protein
MERCNRSWCFIYLSTVGPPYKICDKTPTRDDDMTINEIREALEGLASRLSELGRHL